jgi:DNA-binding NtrC family response regulator
LSRIASKTPRPLLFELRKAGFNPHSVRVSSEVEYLAALNDEFDIVIANYELGRFNGLTALHLLRSRSHEVPFILISKTADEELAVQCIKQGATDYLTKENLSRFGRAVAGALENPAPRGPAAGGGVAPPSGACAGGGDERRDHLRCAAAGPADHFLQSRL